MKGCDPGWGFAVCVKQEPLEKDLTDLPEENILLFCGIINTFKMDLGLSVVAKAKW